VTEGTKQIMQRIADLLPAQYRGIYAAEPAPRAAAQVKE
jgi:hypothetical protein